MRFAITGTDARFLPAAKTAARRRARDHRPRLRRHGHFAAVGSLGAVRAPGGYQIAIARLTAEGAIALLRPETGLSGAHILLLGYGRIARLLARELQKAGALVTAAARLR